ncbi:MAG TPA: MmgE/PrpD family protein [Rhizomicrobium sp.]|nr:MmgE/PrpD family protein [Rhizomicrobium sp.]
MSSDKSASRILAEKLAHVQFSDFPGATIHKAKLHILDTLGAALAGASSPEARAVWQALALKDDAGRSATWGCQFDLNPRAASFINGVAAHALELDDSGGCDHSGAVVVPAALAILPQLAEGVTGRQLLIAILMGYEVGRRVLEAVGGYETHNGAGWHSTGTCGVFGAAAAAGLLLNLDARQMEQALGIACSFAGGTWGFIHDGSQTKKLHPGQAAAGGVTAALLAANGFTGPAKIFDPEAWGSFFKTFAPRGADPDRLIEGFGEAWRLDRCSIKPYATCRGTHSAIDAVRLLLSKHQLKATDITAVQAEMSGFQFGMCGGSAIGSRAEAQMSLPYALAAQLHFGKVGAAEMEESARSSPQIRDWLNRITARIDARMRDEDEPLITLVTGDGRQYSATVPFPYGGPANPLPDDQLIAKFFDLGGLALPPARLEAIKNAIITLDGVSDVRALPQLLKASAEP